MPRTADFRVLAGLDLDVLGCPDFGAALAHERKLVAARHALVAVRGGLIAVEVRCRETADQNDGIEHDRFCLPCRPTDRPTTLVRRVEFLEGSPHAPSLKPRGSRRAGAPRPRRLLDGARSRS